MKQIALNITEESETKVIASSAFNFRIELVIKIRKYLPNCSVSTDIIVGFPSETDKDFQDTLDLMSKVKFNFAYMFKYSSRPGTKASEYSNQMSERIKQMRLEKLITHQTNITLNINKNKVGSFESVLIEKESKKSPDYWSCRSRCRQYRY